MPEQNDKLEKLPYTFIEKLLGALDENVDGEAAKGIIRGCCSAHYDALNVDDVASGYSGDIKGFISFVEKEWGWKVTYNESEGVVTINENKPFCVCPLVQNGEIKNPLLCRCSEGFAQKMFGIVAKAPVTAEVAQSVLMGDKSCIYRIKIPKQSAFRE